MRLVLTRAVEDAARTRAKLEAMGHRVLLSPVMEVVGTGASWPRGVVDAVLATSAKAFGVGVDGPPPEMRRVLPLFLVGDRTAQSARRHGFGGAARTERDADSLLSVLGGLRHRPKRLVYLAGRDRKPTIEQALTADGWAPEVIEVYDARPVETLAADVAAAFGRDAIDGVLHFSRRSAALFLQATRKAGLDISRPAHFCLSEDVAVPLRDAGCVGISVAASPREPDLLALVGQVQARC